MKVLVSLDFGVEKISIPEDEKLTLQQNYIAWLKKSNSLGGVLIEKDFYPMHRINIIKRM